MWGRGGGGSPPVTGGRGRGLRHERSIRLSSSRQFTSSRRLSTHWMDSDDDLSSAGASTDQGSGPAPPRGLIRAQPSLMDIMKDVKPTIAQEAEEKQQRRRTLFIPEDLEEISDESSDEETSLPTTSSGRAVSAPAGRGPARPGLQRSKMAKRNVRQANIVELAQAFELGVKVATHKIESGEEVEAFIGSDAVDWMLQAEFASNRADAEALGKLVMKEIKLFEHIPSGVDFFDDYRFYKFTEVGERTYPEGVEVPKSDVVAPMKKESILELSIEDLKKVASLFRQGVKTGTLEHRGYQYKKCFAGDKAVTWMVDSSQAQSRAAAIRLGQRILKELELFVHVPKPNETEQTFKDDTIFYRFADDHEELKDEEPEFVQPRPSIEQQRSQADFMGVEDDGSSILPSLHESFQYEEDSAVSSRIPHTREERLAYFSFRLRHWAASFIRQDPRQQILDFFKALKQIRDDNSVETRETKKLLRELNDKGFPLNMRLFPSSKASVFTIFRPTSLDAIRKMMMGQAVGKGLDIKGKSAKRGKLSAFVPFLQISENHHKFKVKTLPPNETIRLFFASYDAREDVIAHLLQVGEDMCEKIDSARELLYEMAQGPRDSEKPSDWDELQRALAMEMEDPTIFFIDEYAPNCYGLEIPIRLFWEAYIVRQDISRAKGSQYDTGRPSIPAFQDKNFGALRAKPQDDAPRAVLWQNADPKEDTPLNPLELLMAYEEHGRVYPVVSDFDAFLLGSQRIAFYKPLPSEQLDILQWCIRRIEDVLQKPGPESWTTRWLDILENPWEGEEIHPVFPKFGFGDPVSYSIMENAANMLTGGKYQNGAVRHGAECFNYYFPQELDDEFLVISDHIEGGKAWKYMNATEVQNFLIERIKDGYTFPLNPKWILCDGWGRIYDELMKSDRAEVKISMDTWFPPESGIRESIARIRQKYPRGFVRQKRATTLADVDPSILADILACEASIALPGADSGTGVRALLSGLKPDNDEGTVQKAAISLSSVLDRGEFSDDWAKEIGKSMDNLLYCLDEFLSNPSIQLKILSVFTHLIKIDVKCLTGTNEEFREISILKAACDSMVVHGYSVEMVEVALQVMIGVTPAVSDKAIDVMKPGMGDLIPQIINSHLRCASIQELALKVLVLLGHRNAYFPFKLLHTNAPEDIFRSMDIHRQNTEIQSRGCAIISLLSKTQKGRETVGQRGAIEALITAMVTHPESTVLQNAALNALKVLATIGVNKDLISFLGGEDAVLYSIWINLGDCEVVTNAFKAFNNIAANPETRTVSKMRPLTLHILLVAMRRYVMNEEVQRYAVFLLKSYTFLPDNVQLMSESLDALVPLLFSAAENHPGTCSGEAQSVIETIMG